MSRIILLLMVLALGGCSSLQPAPGSAPEPESILDKDVGSQAVYHLLVAEVAGQRDDLDLAAREYLAAAKVADDPAVAERAARVALYASRDDLAREAAERWLKLDPGAADGHRVLALIALRDGKSDQAYNEFKESLPKAADARDEALGQIGALLAQQTSGGAALDVATRLAKDFPDSRMAHYARAQVALQSQDPSTAVDALDRALDLSPGWRSAQLLRVEALLAANRSREALAALRGLLSKNPNDYDLRLRYARTLVNLSRTDQALSQFRQLLHQRPDDDRVIYAAALLALDAGQQADARSWFERLLAMDVHSDAAHYYLGRMAEQNGKLEEARRQYELAGGSYRQESQLRSAVLEARGGDLPGARKRLETIRRNDPDAAPDAFAVEGELLRDAGRLADSVDVFSRALKDYPDNTDLLYGRAMTRVMMDHIDSAVADFRAVLDHDPGNVNALNALGYTLADSGRKLDEAERLVKKAYAQRPDDPAIIDSMGWVAYRQGRLSEAENYLRQAYKAAPQPDIAAHLGEVLWRMGRHDEAESIWQKALRASPGSEVLQETMDRLQP